MNHNLRKQKIHMNHMISITHNQVHQISYLHLYIILIKKKLLIKDINIYYNKRKNKILKLIKI